jgi:hypothetical protein
MFSHPSFITALLFLQDIFQLVFLQSNKDFNASIKKIFSSVFYSEV